MVLSVATHTDAGMVERNDGQEMPRTLCQEERKGKRQGERKKEGEKEEITRHPVLYYF